MKKSETIYSFPYKIKINNCYECPLKEEIRGHGYNFDSCSVASDFENWGNIPSEGKRKDCPLKVLYEKDIS